MPGLQMRRYIEFLAYLFTTPRKIHKFSIIFPYSPHFFSGKTLDI